jgi:acyl-CoA hydrolase
MEVHLEVWAENIPARERFPCNEAYFTFVAVDHSGHPIQVPELIPQSEAEKIHFDEALKRRQLRLVLAGRLKPSEASELKTLFL